MGFVKMGTHRIRSSTEVKYMLKATLWPYAIYFIFSF